ncbi:MAG: Bax inhibitor-1/YccA family protein [Erysipelotrichaceae bacterium]|nr:Bax inhibitor-1/YccA family protein [Erysipelotrichaceae bacterium]
MNQKFDAFDMDRNELSFNQYIQNVFVYMSLGLLATSASSFLCFCSFAGRGIIYHLLVSFPYAFILIFLIELILSFAMSRFLYRLNQTQLMLLFIVYSILNGLSFSTVFIVYQLSDIFLAFVYATGFFISMTMIGKTTKLDLSKYRTIFIAGLISLPIFSIVSLFIHSSKMDILISWAGLLLFMGLTAYDIQKVRNIYYNNAGESDNVKKLAILGAFELYLDFINMFIYILRIMNNKRNRD